MWMVNKNNKQFAPSFSVTFNCLGKYIWYSAGIIWRRILLVIFMLEGDWIKILIVHFNNLPICFNISEYYKKCFNRLIYLSNLSWIFDYLTLNKFVLMMLSLCKNTKRKHQFRETFPVNSRSGVNSPVFGVKTY